MTPNDQQIIAQGNEMLAQAGMPPLTNEQAAVFLEKYHRRQKENLGKYFGYAAIGLLGFMIGRNR